MFVEDHLNLQLVRLNSPDVWVKTGTGLVFVFPEAGTGKYVSGAKSQELVAGDVLLLTGRSERAQIVPSRGGLAFRKFSARLEHLFPLFTSQEICLLQDVTEGMKDLKHYSNTSKLARECHTLVAEVPPQFNLDHRSQLLRVVAAVFSADFQNAKQQRTGSVRVEERMLQVFERLTMTDIFGLSVDELASRFGCSRRHLNRLFHQHLGVSISALRMEMRLLKAVSLLRNPECKVINVAEECGFNHLGLFNTCFKKRFGVTPGRWRNVERTAGHNPKGLPDGSAMCPLRTNGLCPWTGQVVEHPAPNQPLSIPGANSPQLSKGPVPGDAIRSKVPEAKYAQAV